MCVSELFAPSSASVTTAATVALCSVIARICLPGEWLEQTASVTTVNGEALADVRVHFVRVVGCIPVAKRFAHLVAVSRFRAHRY